MTHFMGSGRAQNKLLKRQNNSTSVPDTLKGSIGLTIDELKEMVADNNCLINLKVLAAFIEDGILPLCHAHSRAIDSKTLAQSATKRLLITITRGRFIPLKTYETILEGDMLGHNSLGEETLFCLRKWKNVGSREGIGELLQAVVRGAKVAQRLCKRWKEAYPDSMDVTPLLLNFSCVGRLAESLAEAWLEGGGSNAISDVRSAKDLKNIMVAGEYSKALLERSQQHTDPVSTTSKEKNLKAEKHRFPQSPLRSTLHYLPPPSLRINNVVPPPEQGEAFILTLQQGHDVPIPPPTDNHLPPPPPQECGIAPMWPCSKISHFLPPPCSEGPPPGHIAPPSDIRPTPLKLGQVGQANGIGANKKRRGKSKKNEENSDALLPEEVASLREDVEKLRPLLDKQDMMAQLVEAKKMAKENHWNAEHWKKMLQNQLLRLLKGGQDDQERVASTSGSGGGSGDWHYIALTICNAMPPPLVSSAAQAEPGGVHTLGQFSKSTSIHSRKSMRTTSSPARLSDFDLSTDDIDPAIISANLQSTRRTSALHKLNLTEHSGSGDEEESEKFYCDSSETEITRKPLSKTGKTKRVAASTGMKVIPKLTCSQWPRRCKWSWTLWDQIWRRVIEERKRKRNYSVEWNIFGKNYSNMNMHLHDSTHRHLATLKGITLPPQLAKVIAGQSLGQPENRSCFASFKVLTVMELDEVFRKSVEWIVRYDDAGSIVKEQGLKDVVELLRHGATLYGAMTASKWAGRLYDAMQLVVQSELDVCKARAGSSKFNPRGIIYCTNPLQQTLKGNIGSDHASNGLAALPYLEADLLSRSHLWQAEDSHAGCTLHAINLTARQPFMYGSGTTSRYDMSIESNTPTTRCDRVE
ncbi:hypothetical protein BT69DRAFT_1302993 [Atractiella rhizophila]|nr:hypothetical protein BT69DRAFT_1302993 [Atractiella rhizophila]